jgi:uncharacterized cysteine cluster protein YcgN (CxxCxxCC family)
MPQQKNDLPFWKKKSLAELSKDEWESLCDCCGRCCLCKVEYEDTGEVYYTDIACKYLDDKTCQCREYERSASLVSDCLKLSPEDVKGFFWLPKTCAYRLVAEGRDLEKWHVLLSSDPESVHRAGISVRDRVVKEKSVSEDDIEDHIIDWVN